MTNIINTVNSAVKNWWVFVILGGIVSLSGFWVLSMPIASYLSISLILSFIVLTNGITDIIVAITNHKTLKGWGWYLSGGVLELFMGLVLVLHPGITMIVLPLILGFWLMFGSVSTISSAFELKSFYIKGWGWILFLGIVLMLLSFLILSEPIFGTGIIVVLTSMAIITYGISYILIGLKLKKVKDIGSGLKSKIIDGLDQLSKDIVSAAKESSDSEITVEDIKTKFNTLKDSVS